MSSISKLNTTHQLPARLGLPTTPGRGVPHSSYQPTEHRTPTASRPGILHVRRNRSGIRQAVLHSIPVMLMSAFPPNGVDENRLQIYPPTYGRETRSVAFVTAKLIPEKQNNKS